MCAKKSLTLDWIHPWKEQLNQSSHVQTPRWPPTVYGRQDDDPESSISLGPCRVRQLMTHSIFGHRSIPACTAREEAGRIPFQSAPRAESNLPYPTRPASHSSSTFSLPTPTLSGLQEDLPVNGANMALPVIHRNNGSSQPISKKDSVKTTDDFDVLKENEAFIVDNVHWSEALEDKLVEHGLLSVDTQVRIKNNI